MTQYAVVYIGLDGGGHSFGPFRSREKAREVFDALMEVHDAGGGEDDIRLEILDPWPGTRAYRAAES